MDNMTPEDKGEYDYEGDMAKSQLRSIIANSKRLHDMMKDDSNLPEWVQSKITLAEDYISTAANYMEGEMNEEAKPLEMQQKKPNSNKKEQQLQKQANAAEKAVSIMKGKINRINKDPKVEVDVKVP